MECRTKGFPYEGKLSAVRLTDEVGAVSSPLPPQKPADRGRERRELLDQEAAEGLNDGGIIQADDRPQDTSCALGKQRSYGQHQRRQGREDPCSQQPPATLSCNPDRQPDGCQRAQQNAARKEPELRHAEPVNAVGQTVRHALPRLQRRDEHQLQDQQREQDRAADHAADDPPPLVLLVAIPLHTIDKLGRIAVQRLRKREKRIEIRLRAANLLTADGLPRDVQHTGQRVLCQPRAHAQPPEIRSNSLHPSSLLPPP